MYQKTRKKMAADRKFASMREARRRQADQLGDPVDLSSPYEPPPLRRVVIVIDYDLGEPRIETFRLGRTGRIDSYAVEHNGKPIPGRIGWTNFCKRLSAHFPRIISPYSCLGSS